MTIVEKILEMLTNLTETVDRHGEQLAQQGTQLAQLQETVSRLAIIQENIVLPRLDTLADGHTHLVKTLATKEQVKELAEDVSIIKDVVRHHRAEINDLKKAQ